MKKASTLLIVLLSNFFAFSQSVVYISKEKAISDIEFLTKTIEEVHYDAYFKTSREDYTKQKNLIFESWKEDSISIKKFTIAGLKLSALLSNGHTSLSTQNPSLFPDLIAHKYIPFKIKSNDKHEFFISQSINKKLQVGDQIISVNGISIDELFKECMSYVGGISSFKTSYVEKVFPLYLFFNEKIKAPYTIQLVNNEPILLEKSLSVQELQNFLKEETTLENYTFEIIDTNIAYLSYNSCEDYDAFELFLSETFRNIKEKNITRLIVDIRNNGGGNSSLNDLLLNYLTNKSYRQSSGRYWKVSRQVKEQIKNDSLWFGFLDSTFLNQYLKAKDGSIIEELNFNLTKPKKVSNYFNGTSCFLIGPNTFSSANFLADAVKTYGISTLIGTSTGEYTNDYGELVEFQLPLSGSYFFVSSTYDIGASGDKSIRQAVLPDIEIWENILEFSINWIKK